MCRTTAETTKIIGRTPKQLVVSPEKEKRISISSSATSLETTTYYYKFMQVLYGATVGCLTFLFSKWFPFFLAPSAANKTYDMAYYHYVKGITFFDNTAWTYATDYALGIAMISIAYNIYFTNSSSISRQLRTRSTGLLLCYTISVFAGGYAHQYFLNIEERNSMLFRILWTLCVGTVTAASGFMGCCGTELVSKLCNSESENQRRKNEGIISSVTLPIISEWFWIGFGTLLTIICMFGGISYQRPACDIFIAGTQQFPPTFYVMLSMMKLCVSKINTIAVQKMNVENLLTSYRILCLIGFIGNAPLLPMYPLLVQYTDWSLASVNTLLHFWLFVSWSLQGISLKYFSSLLIDDGVDNNSSNNYHKKHLE